MQASMHHAGAQPRTSCANRATVACRMLGHVPARMPQSAIRLSSLQPAAHATTRSKAVVVSMYDTALCTVPSKPVMCSTVPCAATFAGEGTGHTCGQHVVHMEWPKARPTHAAGSAAPTCPNSQQQLFAHPARAAAGGTANHATQEQPLAHPAPAAAAAAVTVPAMQQQPLTATVPVATGAATTGCVMQEQPVAPSPPVAAAVTVPAMQQQPLTPTVPVVTGAATTGCVMQEQLGVPSVSACAAGAATADPGDGAVVSFWCGMHTPPNAAAALGGVVPPPVLHCSAAAGTGWTTPLHVQAAAGGRRAWRSACPHSTTAAPCSTVAVHAGKSAGGVPMAASPEERRERLRTLIKEAAAERQVSEEAVSLLDDEEQGVLVKKKMTAKDVLLRTTYDKLVAAGISEGAAEVLKMLFPGPITEDGGAAAGSPLAGVPRASSPEERRERLRTLIKEAATERQVSDELLSVLDEGVLKVLVQKDLTVKPLLLDTPYDELVAIGVSQGAARVLKRLFPGLITEDMSELAADIQSMAHVGSMGEGIAARVLGQRVYAPRRILVDSIIKLATTKGVVLLKGPPRCGKTSLLQLLFLQGKKLKEKYGSFDEVVYLKATSCPPNMSWDDFVVNSLNESWASLTGPRPGGKVLILVDELQVLYSRDPTLYNTLWATVKAELQSSGLTSSSGTTSNTRACLIASALFGDSPSMRAEVESRVGPTAFDIQSDHIISMQPRDDMPLRLTLPDSEYHQLFEKTWQQQPKPLSELFSGDFTRNKIMDLANGHVGVITLILDRLLEAVRTAGQRNDTWQQLLHSSATKQMGPADLLFTRLFHRGALFDYLYNTRGFLRVDNVNAKTIQLYELVLPLIFSDNTPVSTDGLNSTLRKRLDGLGQAGLMQVSTEGGRTVYSLPSKLHLLYCSHRLLQCHPKRVDARHPASFEMLLRLAIPRMSASRLRTTLRKGARGQVDETKFQAEIMVALASVLPRDWNVCPEIEGKHVKQVGTNRLDFMLTPEMWALELLRDGDDLAEHEARFKAGGDCADYGWKKYAVVDFRSHPHAKPRLRKSEPHTYFVLFEDAKYKRATMVHASSGKAWPLKLAP